MKKPVIALLIAAAAFSTSAFAHREWDDDDYRGRDYDHRYHERMQYGYGYAQPPVVVYSQPVVVRERIEYRDRPVYYEQEPARYYAPAPRQDNSRILGQAMGAIAGGVLGNNIGQGNGRIAATAIGAVIGGAMGGNLTDYRGNRDYRNYQ